MLFVRFFYCAIQFPASCSIQYYAVGIILFQGEVYRPHNEHHLQKQQDRIVNKLLNNDTIFPSNACPGLPQVNFPSWCDKIIRIVNYNNAFFIKKAS